MNKVWNFAGTHVSLFFAFVVIVGKAAGSLAGTVTRMSERGESSQQSGSHTVKHLSSLLQKSVLFASELLPLQSVSGLPIAVSPAVFYGPANVYYSKYKHTLELYIPLVVSTYCLPFSSRFPATATV